MHLPTTCSGAPLSEPPPDFDVIVVGAGPAGSCAAYHLARRGRHVLLLDRSDFPRDKACGDGLTQGSVAELARMGMAGDFATAKPVIGVHVNSRGASTADIRHAYTRDRRAVQDAASWSGCGLVVPRWELDLKLSRQARDAGAELWERAVARGPIRRNGTVAGAVVSRGGIDLSLRSRFVIAADGSHSAFARAAGLGETDRWSRGVALRAYFDNVVDEGDWFDFEVPLTAPDEGRPLAGYGWVFPLGAGRANVGVGFFPVQPEDFGVNARRTFEGFVAQLRAADPRFSSARQSGPLRGAPLPSGFRADRCAAPGLLLVGDAAGLVDPFTGEGINSALESGRLAAEVVDTAISSPDGPAVAQREYPRLLSERYCDVFRTGRSLVRSFGFTWKLLVDTLDVPRPLFEGVRRAVINYGTIDTSHEPILPSPADEWSDAAAVAADLEAVRERMADLARSDFPFLAKVADELLEPTGRFLRPALLLAGARSTTPHPARIAAATAVELAYLACVIQDDVLPAEGTRRTSWANRFAVMAGNDLLVHAYALIADVGAGASVAVSRATAEVSLGKVVAGNRPGAGPTPTALAPIYALTCRLGGMLAGVDDGAADRLADYGRYLGGAVEDRSRDPARSRRAIRAGRQCLDPLAATSLRASLLRVADWVEASCVMAPCASAVRWPAHAADPLPR